MFMPDDDTPETEDVDELPIVLDGDDDDGADDEVLREED